MKKSFLCPRFFYTGKGETTGGNSTPLLQAWMSNYNPSHYYYQLQEVVPRNAEIEIDVE